MKNLRIPLALCVAAATASGASGKLVAHFPMDVRQGQIQESISGNRFAVQGHFAPENVPGAVGQALRFDGYTSYVDASLGNILPEGNKSMTFSVWTAVETYPIIKIDENTSEQIAIVSCLDETAKTGFGFFVGFNGKWTFKTFVGGWPVEVKVDTPMPTYQWNCLTAVVDCNSRKVTVYNNGTAVGSGRANGTIAFAGGDLRMGHGTQKNYSGPFLLTEWNGLIDDVRIWDEALSESEIASWTPENPANLDIPASRFAADQLRPRFHGMPAAGWTNECHGMTYADGRYHLFFQKNANGPYMARLHWGHISSENLYDWREERIAVAPGDWYDIKGCWSGCVFTDDEITGGKPNILYTGVDYGRASIDGAAPLDNALDRWQKWSNNPIIAHRPDGLSDDFRDPYFFRNGNNAYIIVGSSKGGVGTTTLHRYDASNKTWSNDGATFFTGSSAYLDGTFWEMPNITQMPDGRWLFTATPLGTGQGVRTIYWTGSINANGTFAPASNFTTGKTVEMNSRDGYGLLSPTIYVHNGKTIALGIVPDKLPSEENWQLGWAHCYSLPREWSLDTDGTLIQKPFEGLTGMRSATAFSADNFTLSGNRSLDPVSGRAAELLGVFKVGSAPFGFRIFDNGTAAGTITYNPTLGEITVDFSKIPRIINDGGVYGGVYRLTLPKRPATGEELKINVFIDHSILDIFINDRWASSIRVFPTASDANGISVFSNSGDTQVVSLKAWTLDANGGSGLDTIFGDSAAASDAPVNVYNTSGMLVRANADPSDPLADLPAGLYIAGGRKLLKR